MDDGLINYVEGCLDALLRARRLGTLAPEDEATIDRLQDLLTRLPRMMRAPHAVLMTALPGAGKTWLAQALSAHGLARLCPDDEMYRRHGKRGRDFPRSQYLVLERAVLDDVAVQFRELLTAGTDVVLDHGLWTRVERAMWRALAEEAGALPLLVYLPVPHDVRWARIQERNRHDRTIPAEFDEQDLLRYATRFHPPGDDEPHLVYDGRPETVVSALCAFSDGQADRTDTTSNE